MPSTPQAPPLLCEDCGYDLQALQDLPEGTPANTSANCPECGRPVHTSLPEHRHGIPLPPVNGKPPSWFASAWAILSTPRKTFGRVRIDADAAKVFSNRSLLIASAIPGCSWIVIMIVRSPPGTFVSQSNSPMLDAVVLFIAAVVAAPMTSGLFFVMFIAAMSLETFGLRQIGRVHRWRISPEVSTTVVRYASVGWVAGVLVATPIMVVLTQDGLASAMASRLSGALVFATLLIPLFWFELLCYLGIRRCKFANPPRIPSGL
jgi:hypothetical protein